MQTEGVDNRETIAWPAKAAPSSILGTKPSAQSAFVFPILQLRLRNKREAKGLKDAAVSLRVKRSALEHELSQERDPDKILELRNEIDRLGGQIEALEHRLSQMGVAVGKWHNLSVTVH